MEQQLGELDPDQQSSTNPSTGNRPQWPTTRNIGKDGPEEDPNKGTLLSSERSTALEQVDGRLVWDQQCKTQEARREREVKVTAQGVTRTRP